MRFRCSKCGKSFDSVRDRNNCLASHRRILGRVGGVEMEESFWLDVDELG